MNIQKTIFLVSLALLVMVSGCVQNTTDSGMQDTNTNEDNGENEPGPGYTDLSPAEAKELIDTNPDVIIIDVSPHYDSGHLPGAVHYYLGDGSLDAAIPTLKRDATYLVYCHVDSVAITGAQKLVDAGFTDVYRLEGNYGAWVAAGYPIES